MLSEKRQASYGSRNYRYDIKKGDARECDDYDHEHHYDDGNIMCVYDVYVCVRVCTTYNSMHVPSMPFCQKTATTVERWPMYIGGEWEWASD